MHDLNFERLSSGLYRPVCSCGRWSNQGTLRRPEDLHAVVRELWAQHVGFAATADRPVGSILDEHLRKFDQEAATRAGRQSAEDATVHGFKRHFDDLVADFLRRMSDLGNPGTDWDMKEGGIFGRKVMGWRLAIGVSERFRRFPLTIDGRMPRFGTGARSADLVPFQTSEIRPDAGDLDTLGKSMAAILARCRR